MSSLTPRGDGVDGDDGESGFGFGGDFGSAALALMLVSSSSLSLSSSLSEFAMDLANQDIALDLWCCGPRRLLYMDRDFQTTPFLEFIFALLPRALLSRLCTSI